MDHHVDDKKNSEVEKVETKEERGGEEVVDPELFSCLLQPLGADADGEYVGVRRLLLYRKAQAGVYRRNVWVSDLTLFPLCYSSYRRLEVSCVNVKFRNFVFLDAAVRTVVIGLLRC